MSFRPAGAWPVLLIAALAGALGADAALAQAAKPAPAVSAQAAKVVAASTGSAPADAAAIKPGDATAGAGKAAVCGACHGMDGNSTDPQYPKLAGQQESYIVLQLESFKSGKRQNPIMAGFASALSEQDMHDIGAYFASKRSLPGVADETVVAQGQQLFREGDVARGIPACMACHSIDGRGNPGAIYPQLAGQHAQYVEATLKAWQAGTRWGDDPHAVIMQGIAQRLTPQEITAVSSYVEGLHAVDNAAAPVAASP